jgi:FlaA1/EpsC-like NDP-sugar epimerase
VEAIVSDARPLDGKRILVTGGTGSLGKVLVRRLLSNEMGTPGKIIVLSRDEAKQQEMRMRHKRMRRATEEIIYRSPGDVLEFRIGDVRDFDTVSAVLREVDIVFNAAALKQVPTCEYFPFEAVRTNVQGAENIVRAIQLHDLPVDTVVGVSTDKACKPVNVMACAKRSRSGCLCRATCAASRRGSSALGTATCWPREAQ